MMAHDNKIYDSEPHFVIDPETRLMTTASAGNNTIVQYDHNSERFTFEIPRFVDGHDMSESASVRIHYRNSSANGMNKTNGVYTPTDLEICGENADVLTFSWLLSSATTQYIGNLHFSIQFLCFEGDEVVYSWNTGVYKDINIIESINNTEEVVVNNVDILEQWRQELFLAGGDAAHNVYTARDIAISEIEAKGVETIDSIPDDYTDLSQSVDRNYEIDSKNNKRIVNIEQGFTAANIDVDDTVAYVKDIPSIAPPYAEVLKVGGMSYKSKNLYNSETASNGYYNADGTITATSGSTLSDFIYIDGRTVTFSAELTKSGDNLRLVAFDKDKTFIERKMSSKAQTYSNPNAMYVRISVFNTNYDKDTMQLEYGDTATEFEPYFDGIRHAAVTEIESVGVNLFNNKNTYQRVGLTFVFDGSQVSITGTATDTYATIAEYKALPFGIEAGKTYSMSAIGASFQIAMWFYNSSGTLLETLVSGQSAKTIPSTATKASLFFRQATKEKTYNETAYVMLNEGNTALEYVPYFAFSQPIPEAIQSLDGYGVGISKEVNDYFAYEDDGRVTWNKKLRGVDMGALSWEHIDGKWFAAPVGDKAVGLSNLLCDKYPLGGVGFTGIPDKSITGSAEYRYIYVRDAEYSDAATLKAALSGVMLYYELATPEVTDITDLITADNMLPIEPGGTVTFVNEHSLAVPSTLKCKVKSE